MNNCNWFTLFWYFFKSTLNCVKQRLLARWRARSLARAVCILANEALDWLENIEIVKTHLLDLVCRC